MPYSYTIDVDRRLVIAVFWGEATIAEADALMAELYADPRHSFSLNRVYDCREMTRLPPITEVRGLAELFRQRIGSGARTRRAMVVRPGATYGLARMFQALLDLVGIELNRSPTSMKLWTGQARRHHSRANANRGQNQMASFERPARQNDAI